MLGHSGAAVGTNVVDYLKNPVYSFDSMGIVTINGGYDGIYLGGTAATNSKPTHLHLVSTEERVPVPD